MKAQPLGPNQYNRGRRRTAHTASETSMHNREHYKRHWLAASFHPLKPSYSMKRTISNPIQFNANSATTFRVPASRALRRPPWKRCAYAR